MKNIKRSISWMAKSPLTLACFGSAVYFVVSQFLTFLENKDSSSIGFKTFQSSADPLFPAFTICLESNIMRSQNHDWKGIIDTSLLTSNENIRFETYIESLKGNQQTRKKSLDLATTANEISFENVSLQMHDFFEGYTIPKKSKTELKAIKRDDKGNLISDYSKSADADIRKLPLETSYQDLSRVCISRQKEHMFEYLKEYEEIELRLENLKKKLKKISKKGKDIKVVIYIHHLGRLIRNEYKPVFESFVNALGPIMNTDLLGIKKIVPKWNNQFEIAIDDVRVVRMRSSNPTTKCKSDPKMDDDSQFMTVAMTKVGCVPSYWKRFMDHLYIGNVTRDLRLPECSSSYQMSQLIYFLKNSSDVFESYDKPCDEMTVRFHLNQLPREFGRSEDMYFKLTYTREQYEEVVNSRALEFISWFANVGGFIGIFLGYNFLQAINSFFD